MLDSTNSGLIFRSAGLHFRQIIQQQLTLRGWPALQAAMVLLAVVPR